MLNSAGLHCELSCYIAYTFWPRDALLERYMLSVRSSQAGVLPGSRIKSVYNFAEREPIWMSLEHSEYIVGR